MNISQSIYVTANVEISMDGFSCNLLSVLTDCLALWCK